MSLAINRIKSWMKAHPTGAKWLWFVGIYCATIIGYGIVETLLHLSVKYMT